MHPSRFFFLTAFLLLLLFVWGPTQALAQIIFETTLSERGQKMVTDCENMAQLAEIVGEHGIIIFEGERPVMAKQIVFVVGERGEVKERFASEAFKLEPGKHRLSEHFPRERFLALFGELSSEGYSLAANEENYITGFGSFSPYDNRVVTDRALEEMRLDRGQEALILAVQPEDTRDKEMIRLRPKISPMAFALGSDRK